MPGIDLKFGEVTTTEKTFHENEPVFIIRGQDPLATQIIHHYRDAAIRKGCDREHIDAVSRAIEEFHKWQNENSDLVKEKPDS